MSITISIIGGTGKMGQMFAKAFKKAGCKVIISGRNTILSHKEAAEKGDIVIVSVPIRVTKNVIKKIGRYVRRNALLTDFTSVKMLPAEWMKKYCKSEIIAGHPVFGPLKNIRGQNFVICPVRGQKHLAAYKKLLESLGLKVTIITPEEHDRHMAVIQCLVHQSNLAFAAALRQLNYNLKKGESLASPQFRLKISAVRRMLDQNAQMYADIQRYNPYTKETAKKLLSATHLINEPINFEAEFKKCQKFFGMMNQQEMTFVNKLVQTIKP